MKRVLLKASFRLGLGILTLAAIAGAQDREDVKLVFQHPLPNVQGKSMVAVVVSYAPGGKSVAHRHAPSAFIYAYVLSGSIRSRIGDEPAKIYKAGEDFYEVPGSHHTVSENASDQEPASILAIFVVDSQHSDLTIPDRQQ
jgi:quercetin dioxygenase-like cupin family protein